MSNPSRLLAHMGMLLLSLCTASVASADYADPPGRVALLSDTQGVVSYSPAGENDWVSVVRNRPLIRGDRLWTDFDSRAELQLGSAAVRIASNTSVDILDLSDNVAQFRLTQGALNLSVRRMYQGEIFEVDTPTLAFTINRPGRYRIDVDPSNNSTTIGVWEGAGEAYGENASFPLSAGDTVRFYSADLLDYEMVGVPPEDDFDRYCSERDRLLTRSVSLRYLDDDVVGYADLDEYGAWRPVGGYGVVWFPSMIYAGWAPYRDGHWIWQEPWGWTWVDDAPWGFAPSHYGRWVYVSHRWGWIPGPRHVRPIYAPALVAFVSDSGWSVSLSIGGGAPIGWFPLGPQEVYVPSYHASRDYFTRVNVNNTVVNNTTIINVYNVYASGTVNISHVNYANRQVAGAVTVVPRNVFVNSQPVRAAAITLDRKSLTGGEITRVAPIAPSVRSVIGAGTAARARPSQETFERRVLVRNAPPPVESPFAAREQQLQKNPGRPLEPRTVSRDENTAQQLHLRVIGDQSGAVNARTAGSRRSGGMPGSLTPVPGHLQPLERPAAPPAQEQLQRQVAPPPQEERRRQAAPPPQEEPQGQVAPPPPQEQLQRRVAPPQQEQRQRQVAPPPQEQAAKMTPEQRRAECIRQAILQHKDPAQCGGKTKTQENQDNPKQGERKRE